MHKIQETKLLCEKLVGFVRHFEQHKTAIEFSINNLKSLEIEKEYFYSLDLKLNNLNSSINKLKNYISSLVLELTEQYPESAEIFVEVFQTHFQIQRIDHELNNSQIYINDFGLLREFKLID